LKASAILFLASYPLAYKYIQFASSYSVLTTDRPADIRTQKKKDISQCHNQKFLSVLLFTDVVQCKFEVYVPLTRIIKIILTVKTQNFCKMTFHYLVKKTEFGHTGEETEDNQQYSQDVVST